MSSEFEAFWEGHKIAPAMTEDIKPLVEFSFERGFGAGQAKLTAQRDELLEACKRAVDLARGPGAYSDHGFVQIIDKVQAAIERVEKEGT